MQDTAALQGSPASLPLHRRTLHQIMCDPTLSCQARVVIGMMHPPLLMHGRLQISNEEIAQALGYSYREAQRATAELEEAQIIISKRGGRAAKYYALGPAIVGGDNDGQTIYYVASEQKDVHRSDVSATTVILRYESEQVSTEGSDGWPPASRQMPLDLQNDALSRSRTSTRGEIYTQDSSLVVKNTTTTTPRERAREDSSSSSLLKKLTGFGLAESSAHLVLRDWAPGSDCACVQCHGQPCTRIQRQVELMPVRADYAQRKGDPIRDVGGVLFKAIAGDWGAPAGFKAPQIRQWQIDAAERQLETLAKPSSKSADEIAKEREINRDRALAYLAQLPLEERERVERTAADRAKALRVDPLHHGAMFLLAEIHRHAHLKGVTL